MLRQSKIKIICSVSLFLFATLSTYQCTLFLLYLLVSFTFLLLLLLTCLFDFLSKSFNIHPYSLYYLNLCIPINLLLLHTVFTILLPSLSTCFLFLSYFFLFSVSTLFQIKREHVLFYYTNQSNHWENIVKNAGIT